MAKQKANHTVEVLRIILLDEDGTVLERFKYFDLIAFFKMGRNELISHEIVNLNGREAVVFYTGVASPLDLVGIIDGNGKGMVNCPVPE